VFDPGASIIAQQLQDRELREDAAGGAGLGVFSQRVDDPTEIAHSLKPRRHESRELKHRRLGPGDDPDGVPRVPTNLGQRALMRGCHDT
jgi:hypothetical protein